MKRDLNALAADTFDLLVLGGGITGAGVALDAALNGWRVALIDRGDFASGASSASSKLVHGGLRYLEHGNFRLVYEALHERRLLLGNAPHLVRPLRFVIPTYQGARVSTWKWRAGLTLYDLLAGRSNIGRSRPLGVARLHRECPSLRRDGLLAGAGYFDAQMDDARLAVEVIRTACAHGLCAANYVEAVGFDRAGDRIVGVRARDRLSGAERTIAARQVLNTTGPWVDVVCRLAGDEAPARLRPTKGAHVIGPPRGLTSAFVLLHPADGRVFFVMPWEGERDAGNHETVAAKTLIGTTDTHWDGPPGALRVTPEEIDYLLTGYNRYFDPPLSPADVLGSFAGLRPLIRNGAAEPSARTREFRLFTSPSGLISVAGGKYTTYRHMGEVIASAVAHRLGRRHRSVTAHFPLDGTPAGPWPKFTAAAEATLRADHGLSLQAAAHLVNRYGRRAFDVAAYLKDDPGLARPVVAGGPDLRVEFHYQRDHEMAVRPEDFLLRRTRLGLVHPELLASPPRTLGL